MDELEGDFLKGISVGGGDYIVEHWSIVIFIFILFDFHSPQVYLISANFAEILVKKVFIGNFFHFKVLYLLLLRLNF